MGASQGALDAPHDRGHHGGHQMPPVTPPMLLFDNLVKKLDKLSL